MGPLHGGVNEAALNMLKEIGDVKNIPKYIEKAKDKKDPFKLMGFGHRVYKNYDPRAKVMQKTCHEVLNEIGNTDNKLLQVAKELEKIALNDEYFIEKKLYPNIDFLFRDNPKCDGLSNNYVYGIIWFSENSGMVSTLERNDGRSKNKDWKTKTTLYRA